MRKNKVLKVIHDSISVSGENIHNEGNGLGKSRRFISRGIEFALTRISGEAAAGHGAIPTRNEPPGLTYILYVTGLNECSSERKKYIYKEICDEINTRFVNRLSHALLTISLCHVMVDSWVRTALATRRDGCLSPVEREQWLATRPTMDLMRYVHRVGRGPRNVLPSAFPCTTKLSVDFVCPRKSETAP